MERIVVGVDGSSSAGAALRWAAEIAVGSGSGLTVLHAYHNPYSEVSPEMHRQLMDERAALLADDWSRPAHDAGAAVETRIVEGDPRQVLLDLGGGGEADLIVLGRGGAGGSPGLLHVGSVVEHLAHHAHVPLAVIPQGSGGPIGAILVGLDGSDASAAAARWTAALASSIEAEVIAVNVADPRVEHLQHEAQRHLAAWISPMTDAGVGVDARVVPHQGAASGLLEAVAEHGATLCVVGTRGAGGFIGLRFGGVAMKMLHHATTPLVLVPPGDGAAR
jgi:nucleotide-binding universal stress UspA family protein